MNGEVLGNRYELLEKVGEGGMAVVYKARCNKLNRFVAVKILKKEYADNKEIVDKFKDEAMAVAKLSDSNIVNVLDVGSDDNENYIVMEYVNGKTLKDLVDEYGKLSYETAVRISLQIANALECAHKNGIVHRDIKPQNILVNTEGRAKVTDFGIAKSVDSATLTNTSTIMGSAHYFSPEQAKGGMVDYRSDIYSLGIVMYEMITGKVPFDGDSPVTIALKHIQEKPVDPREINPKIPESYSKIILKCIEKNVDDRYSNAKEVIEDLKKIKDNPNMTIGEKSGSSKVGGETIIMSPIKEEDLEEFKNNDENRLDDEDLDDDYYYDEDDDEYYDEDEDEEKIEPKKDRNKEEKKTKKGLLIGIAIAVIIIILGAGSAFMFLNSGTSKKAAQVQVPSVVGMTEASAKSALEKEGLVGNFTEVQNSAPKGTVLNVNPSAGTSVNKGTTVNVEVSKGVDEITVPNLAGESKDGATKQLNALGINSVLYTAQYSDSVEAGVVISSTPQAGSKVAKTDGVTLVISKGPKVITQQVPSVVGMTQSQAENALSNAGFSNVSVQTTTTNDQSQDGNVISVSPGSGNTVNQNTTITITVGKYQAPKPTTQAIPSVVGMSENAAKGALSNAGFTNVTVQTSKTTDKSQDGNVISVSPGAGNSVTPNTAITITVAQYEAPEPTTPPEEITKPDPTKPDPTKPDPTKPTEPTGTASTGDKTSNAAAVKTTKTTTDKSNQK
ncbi:Stk1 family PASTA domain-containing Ser/Thr kinase [uncultured Clostridium sp.]|uniref:Stk1 family PASTA domain-containing Ser/Thr kinase n=1 Tax=uncultured Clostridium sp. TaxID=59620 RepID=UPI002604B71B|nr:Stk1 family PASTA domain-containing Ser/Thr kinase [uncultured Clostridium sp.]